MVSFRAKEEEALFEWKWEEGKLDKWERLHLAHHQNEEGDDDDNGDNREGDDDDNDDRTGIFPFQLQVSIGGNPISLILKLTPKMAATDSASW